MIIKNWKRLLKKFNPEIVFHLAAQPLIFDSYLEPLNTININSIGTLNVLDILKKQNQLNRLSVSHLINVILIIILLLDLKKQTILVALTLTVHQKLVLK